MLTYVFTYAQQDDTLKFNNRKYKQEIGIDFKGLFAGNPGAAMVWKVRYDKKNLVSVSYADYFRYQLAVNGNMEMTPKNNTINYSNTVGSVYHFKNGSYFSVEPMIGKERVNFFGKFNFFYGLDLGLFFRHNDPGYGYYTNFNDPNVNYYYGYYGSSISNQFGADAIAFFGMKYHFTEQFSISAETGLSLSYAHSAEKYYDWLVTGTQSSPSISATTFSNAISTSAIYLRLLSLNYNIKRY
jgi:hypothetical protein